MESNEPYKYASIAGFPKLCFIISQTLHQPSTQKKNGELEQELSVQYLYALRADVTFAHITSYDSYHIAASFIIIVKAIIVAIIARKTMVSHASAQFRVPHASISKLATVRKLPIPPNTPRTHRRQQAYFPLTLRPNNSRPVSDLVNARPDSGRPIWQMSNPCQCDWRCRRMMLSEQTRRGACGRRLPAGPLLPQPAHLWAETRHWRNQWRGRVFPFAAK